ncbi:hypothetical protein [Salinimonas lutimaris]|uniref:hypothetical protein n=1 Tax=Salinimonas lutimaris TaxID=914153 RepID=UPI0010C0E5E9|nr:hypothetical protein [Salinimonas lutimaris]
MNFNLDQGETNSNDSVFDAISAFCLLKRLEVKELQSGETTVPVSAVLSNGARLQCYLLRSGAMLLTLRQHNQRSRFTLVYRQQQWQILAAA